MELITLTTTSDSSTVTATAASLGGALFPRQLYLLVSSTNCWIRQGTSRLVTCVTKANLLDTDFITITTPAGTKVFEFDVSGNGVTIGRVQVNVSSDTTAATVATRLRTSLLAAQIGLEVTDNADGTLTVVVPDGIMTITENVVNAGFTVTTATMTVAAADGSMYLPAGTSVVVTGDQGPQLAVIRDSVDGKCSLTRCSRL